MCRFAWVTAWCNLPDAERSSHQSEACSISVVRGGSYRLNWHRTDRTVSAVMDGGHVTVRLNTAQMAERAATHASAEPVGETAPLEVRIHRGGHEIGGNCVELRHGQDTLILDIGKPLTAAWGEVVPLPAAIGLDEDGTRPLGVVISHGHQDHWGLATQLPTDIPVFIGEGAANILRAAQFWGSGVDLHEAGHLHDRVPFTLGPFTITPYLADHSAYDAFSLLVEAGGRSLFYTGDIRGHGRKASAFDRLLADPPSKVNALLMEGTSFRTHGPVADASEPTPQAAPEVVTLTEADVEVS